MNKLTNEKVIFCSKCVESNQRYVSSIQHEDAKETYKNRTSFNQTTNICSACLYFEKKKKINWDLKEKQLKEICNRFRKNDGSYDILIPGSGGKDSSWVSHIMKSKYKMNPLTVTWAPHMYTDIGYQNFQNWINSGFDNILFTPNPKVHKILTRLAFENLLHPFQPFALGQLYWPVKAAIQHGIKFIMYGDAQAEKAGDDDLWQGGVSINPKVFTYKNKKDLFFGGVNYYDLKKYGINEHDIKPYMPIEEKEFIKHDIENLVLPFFENQNPHTNYYLAAEKSNFKPREQRSDGTYSKYTSIDDKIDDLHHYTWFIKTGRGRCTDDAALEVRNRIIDRDEAVALVRKYDGEYPKTFLKENLEYLDLTEEKFNEIIDKFRPKHLWEKKDGKWFLKSAVWK
jgi:N-acetyl sugar amidotransferase